MRKQWLTIMVLSIVAVTTSQASLVWTGAGDGVSLYQEANWLGDNGSVPADGEVNPGTPITTATAAGLIQIISGTGSPANFGGNFDLGIGNDLEVGGGKSLGTATSGIRVDTTGSNPANSTGTISGASTVRATFTLDIDWIVDEGSTLRLNGAGNPLNLGTVNLLDTASVILFENETYAQFDTEHSGKVTYNGGALDFGTDAFVAEAGDNALATAYNGALGVQIQAIPEPAVITMMVAFGGGLLFLRRRLNF